MTSYEIINQLNINEISYVVLRGFPIENFGTGELDLIVEKVDKEKLHTLFTKHLDCNNSHCDDAEVFLPGTCSHSHYHWGSLHVDITWGLYYLNPFYDKPTKVASDERLEQSMFENKIYNGLHFAPDWPDYIVNLIGHLVLDYGYFKREWKQKYISDIELNDFDDPAYLERMNWLFGEKNAEIINDKLKHKKYSEILEAIKSSK